MKESIQLTRRCVKRESRSRGLLRGWSGVSAQLGPDIGIQPDIRDPAACQVISLPMIW
ncbi:hypothetical protein K402DRAFT_398924 [Aulographum hederae CBS 113979]|uniref:Uncharacterized protein n=1 Tax=Aulographum hederae CBS 113979 TaxID=1176131 RepID=A0A6G1GJ73_9PEZI|nr:hypothetical protein K402DRAFT_398924 [Aulographum hederae CBS 113979]